MRFVMISLLIDCLLFLGISYLAFGNTEIVTTDEMRIHENVHYIDDVSCGSSFENAQKFFRVPPEIGCIMCQNTTINVNFRKIIVLTPRSGRHSLQPRRVLAINLVHARMPL